MARFPLQIVSPQTLAAFRALSRFFTWLFVHFKAKWRGFLLRFAPLWLPIVLILALPMPREIAIANGLGNLFSFAGITFFRPNYDSVFQHAQQESDNLGAQLSAVPFTYLTNQAPDYDTGEMPHPRDEWLLGIERHFHEAWLPAYLIRCRIDATSYAYGIDSYPYITPTADMYQQRLQRGGLSCEPLKRE